MRGFVVVRSSWLLTLLSIGALADEESHEYKDKEKVVVWTDKVGPYNNPQETYPFETLGLCELQGSDIESLIVRKDSSIGEAIEGHEFVSSPRLKVQFGVTMEKSRICEMKLDANSAEQLEQMIRDNYWYQLYIDDLPLQAFVGEHSKFGVDMSRFSLSAANRSVGQKGLATATTPVPQVPKEYKGKHVAKAFQHRHFTLFKNGNQIIEIDMEPSNPWPVYPGVTLNFTYSITWYNTKKLFKDRYERYLETRFFEHKVHWFSIVNSFMLCLFLCAVVGIILMKTLKKDFARYSVTDAEELESLDRASDESGWKQVNGDVFRRPTYLLTFSMVYASGVHLAGMVLVVLIMCITNSYYTQRGTTATSLVIAYLFTAIGGGYEGGRLFRMYGGQNWKRAFCYQCALMPVICMVTFSIINTTAILYRSTMAIPFRTIIIVVFLFIIVSIPLNMVGTLLGRKAASRQAFPCRVHHLKRPIPAKHRFFTPLMVALAGIVPFGCLFIEMYFIFSAVWSHNKVYYVYGFMLAILLLLSLVLVCVSITCVYVLLSAEDYRWAWHSFVCSSACSGYVFLYTVYYYYNSTQMSGFFQWIYYFGVSINFCIGLGLFAGSLGYFGASKFVFTIYDNIKVE